MKKIIKLAAIACIFAAPAFADSETKATIEDHYRVATSQTPYTERNCQIVDVPIYGERGQASTGDTVLGAIIGGALGNQVGSGSGKNAATVLGAIVGADVANKNAGDRQIVGYRQEEHCSNVTRYRTHSQNEYSHSTITFYENGQKYTISFQK